MRFSEVIDTLDSSGDFDELMAEGSDDDLGMDIDNDYESDNSEGILQQDKIYKILKLQFYNIIELDGMDAEEPPSDDTSHSSEPVISQPANVSMA